ncbi:hypothetical protein M885DRAFT_558646 [Pelagophyceae sp. CCMP2097]|nr:hypothetical protein M885DRAFT_558646 [Pelagophyceae sp. CCMP2097]
MADEVSCPVCGLAVVGEVALGAHLDFCRIVSVASLAPHVKKCEDMARSCAALGMEDAPLALKPSVPMPTARGDVVGINAWNVAARAAFEDSLPKCGGCGRQFVSTRLLMQHAERCEHRHRARPPASLETKTRSGVAGGEWEPRDFRPSLPLGVGDADPAVAKILSRANETNGGAVCHFCGLAALVSSLPRHAAACEQRWERSRPGADKPQLDLEPPKFDDDRGDAHFAAYFAALEAYNRAAARAYVFAVRGPTCGCAGCGRTFADAETLAKHEARCLSSRKSKEPRPFGSDAEPRFLGDATPSDAKGVIVVHRPADEPLGAVCYLCGNHCLVWSLDRHIARCKTRFGLFEQARSKSEPFRQRPDAPRTPEPPATHTYFSRRKIEAPPDAEASAAAAAADAAAAEWLRTYNDEARIIYLKLSQCSCKNCGRSFDDKLKRDSHQLRCLSNDRRGDFPAGDGRPAAATTALCPICGKHALLGSLLLHLDECSHKWERARHKRPQPPWPDVALPFERGPELEAWNAAVTAERRTWNRCPTCDRGFERSAKLKAHVKRCCPDKLAGLAEEVDTDDDEVVALSPPRPSKADPTCVCFLCGRRYGSASILPHVRACETKWNRENAILPPGAQRALRYPEIWPPPDSEAVPDGASQLVFYNEEAVAIYKELNQSTCPKCARTFDSHGPCEKHMAHCCPNRRLFTFIGEAEKGELPDGEAGDTGGVVCDVCGCRVRTVASFAWHRDACAKRWLADSALLPKHRRPKRRKVFAEVPDASSDKAAVDLWNAAATAAYQKRLLPCPADRCPRRFPDEKRLKKHMAACCPLELARKIDSERIADFEADLGLERQASQKDQRVGVSCHLCGRRVVSNASLPFHYKACLAKWRAYEDERPAADQRLLPPVPKLKVGDAETGDVPDPSREPGYGIVDDAVDVPADDAGEDDDYGGDGDFEDDDPPTATETLPLCYTCGTTREPAARIHFHTDGCRKRWRARERLRPAAWRRRLPRNLYALLPAPNASFDFVTQWNAAVLAAAPLRDKKCDRCGRTFSDDGKLQAHQTSCLREPKCEECGKRFAKGDVGEADLRRHACGSPEETEEVLPYDYKDESVVKSVVCYVCGRRCLLSSAKMHITRCEVKFNEAKTDRTVPAEVTQLEWRVLQRPLLKVPGRGASTFDVQSYSAQAAQIYHDARPACTFCDRKFDDGPRLLKHHQNCASVEWVLDLTMATTASKCLLRLADSFALSEACDAALKALVLSLSKASGNPGARGGGQLLGVRAAGLLGVRFEYVVVANSERAVRLRGGVFGAHLNASLTFRGLHEPRQLQVPDGSSELFSRVHLLAAKRRPGVVDEAKADKPFVSLLGDALMRRQASTAYKEPDEYDAPSKIVLKSTLQRRDKAELLDRRNFALAAKLRGQKATFSTNETNQRPKHCHATGARKRGDEERRRDNAKLQRALGDIYRDPREHKRGIKAVDVSAKFAQRTALYDQANEAPFKPEKPRAAWSGPLDEEALLRRRQQRGAPKEETVHDVPATLAIASCAACGLRAFYGADGQPMRPCVQCGKVYYCDHTCAAVDAPAHALACEHERAGGWNVATRKRWPVGAAKSWVDSSATRVAREALLRRPKPSVEAVMREIALARQADDEADKGIKPFFAADKESRRLGDAPRTAGEPPWRADADREWATGADADRAAAIARMQSSPKAYEGALEVKLRRLDEAALAIALERVDVLRQRDGATARDQALRTDAIPSDNMKKQKRDSDLAAAERRLTRTPNATSADIGQAHRRAKPEALRQRPPARSMFVSQVTVAHPDANSAGRAHDNAKPEALQRRPPSRSLFTSQLSIAHPED